MDTRERGTGKTTQQMKDAPSGAVFVWCNNRLEYPSIIARKLGRDDLEIVSPSFLDDKRWCGRMFSDIVLDHALNPSRDQRRAYELIKSRYIIQS